MLSSEASECCGAELQAKFIAQMTMMLLEILPLHGEDSACDDLHVIEQSVVSYSLKCDLMAMMYFLLPD